MIIARIRFFPRMLKDRPFWRTRRRWRKISSKAERQRFRAIARGRVSFGWVDRVERARICQVKGMASGRTVRVRWWAVMKHLSGDICPARSMAKARAEAGER